MVLYTQNEGGKHDGSLEKCIGASFQDTKCILQFYKIGTLPLYLFNKEIDRVRKPLDLNAHMANTTMRNLINLHI